MKIIYLLVPCSLLLIWACSSSKPRISPEESVRQSMFLAKMQKKCQAQLQDVQKSTKHIQALETQKSKCQQLDQRQIDIQARSGLNHEEWELAWQKEVKRQADSTAKISPKRK